MVLRTTLDKEFARLGESPPCLWEDKLKKRMHEIFTSGEVIIFSSSLGGVVLQPVGTMLKLDDSRIEAVNKYFRIKAGQVFESAKALELLAELSNRRVIPKAEWKQFDISQNGVALAMLAAAGFCEVNDYSITITDQGKQFLDDILK